MISSVQLLVLGLIGEYVGRIYIQSKNRPLFVISHIHRRGRLPHNAADGEGDIERDVVQNPAGPIGTERAAAPLRRGLLMKAILSHPALYQAYQNAGGFFGARIKAIADYLTLRPGMRVIDIGCGPAISCAICLMVSIIPASTSTRPISPMRGGRSAISAPFIAVISMRPPPANSPAPTSS